MFLEFDVQTTQMEINGPPISMEKVVPFGTGIPLELVTELSKPQ